MSKPRPPANTARHADPKKAPTKPSPPPHDRASRTAPEPLLDAGDQRRNQRATNAPLGFMLTRKLKSRIPLSITGGHALYQQGRRAMEADELDRAIEFFHGALKAGPHAKSFELLGECHLRLQQYADAARALQSAVELGDRPFRALFLLAQTRRAQGKRQEAVEHLQTALRLKSDYKSARELLNTLHPKNDPPARPRT